MRIEYYSSCLTNPRKKLRQKVYADSFAFMKCISCEWHTDRQTIHLVPPGFLTKLMWHGEWPLNAWQITSKELMSVCVHPCENTQAFKRAPTRNTTYTWFCPDRQADFQSSNWLHTVFYNYTAFSQPSINVSVRPSDNHFPRMPGAFASRVLIIEQIRIYVPFAL